MNSTQFADNSRRAIRIAAPAEPAFAPLWLADDLGLFAEEQIAIQWVATSPGTSALDLFSAGDVDVIVGSLWFALARPELGLACIGQVNSRCHHLLVARSGGHGDSRVEAIDLFDADSTILVPGHAPTPTVALLAGIERASLSSPHRLIPLPSSAAVEEEFVAGIGDLAVIPLDRARAIGAQTVLDIPTRLGPVPWSVLFANANTVSSHAPSLERMLRAVGKAGRWLQHVDIDRLQDVARHREWLAASWTAVRSYSELGLWKGTPQIDRQAAARWIDILVSFRLGTATPTTLSGLLGGPDRLTGVK